MRMRRLLAAVAATATLLGGMAFGAAAASAEDVNSTTVTANGTFTFTAEKKEQLTGAQLTAYKLVDYVNYGTTDKPIYGVKTVAGADRTKLAAALTKAGFKNVPDTTKDTTTDLMAWAMGQKKTVDANGKVTQVEFDVSDTRPWNDPSVTRKFANALKNDNPFSAVTVDGKTILTLSEPKENDNKTGWTATVTLPQGLYLFLDSATKTDTYTPSVPIIVGTGSIQTNDQNEKTGVLLMGDSATVDMKNTVTSGATKTVDKTSASVGDTVKYTLTYLLPNPVPDGYTFQFTDTPSKGLTIDFGTLTVTAGAGDDSKTLTQNDDYTLTNNLTSNKGDGSKTFEIKINKPAAYAGKTIIATYNATINSEAENDKVSNGLNVGNDHDSTTTELFKFDFKKINAQKQDVQGATFKISVEDGQTGSLPTGYQAEQTSDAKGKVTFTGLAAGTYTVTETQVADGYQNYTAKFTVTINTDGTFTFSRDEKDDPHGLVNTTDKTVLNVKNVTELPKTGAAGTALFVVLACLLGGAAGVVYLRSRKAKAMLR